MGSGEAGQRERGRGRLGDPNRKSTPDESFVSPCVKWLMFSFNMFFWVSYNITNSVYFTTLSALYLYNEWYIFTLG